MPLWMTADEIQPKMTAVCPRVVYRAAVRLGAVIAPAQLALGRQLVAREPYLAVLARGARGSQLFFRAGGRHEGGCGTRVSDWLPSA